MPAYPMTEEPIALPTGGVRTLIRDLGGDENPGNPPYPYTGAVQLTRAGKNASIWVHGGIMYAAHLDGYNPPVALRLRTARFLNDQQFAELQAMSSGDAGPEAVDRNWVPAYIVEELHREVMLSTLSHLYDWNDAQWWWEEDETTDLFVTSGLPLMLASAAVDERIGQWKAVTRAYPHVVQPKSIPYPGPSWDKRAVTIVTPEMESMLACVDGRNSIAQIAAYCGLTRFEIAKILSQTVAVGIITFSAGTSIANAPAPMPTQRHTEKQGFPGAPDPSALAAAPPPMMRESQPTPPGFPVPATSAGDSLLSEPISYTSPDAELQSGSQPASKSPEPGLPPEPPVEAMPAPDEQLVEEEDFKPLAATIPEEEDDVVEDVQEIDNEPIGEGEDDGEKPASTSRSNVPESRGEIRELNDELGAILARVEAIRGRLDELDK